MGVQVKIGATGARGPRAAGPPGKIGKPGRKRLKGLKGPLSNDDVLNVVGTYFEDVYRRLNAQTKQIVVHQTLLDVLVAKAARSDSRRS
jgi:hypothetical protein